MRTTANPSRRAVLSAAPALPALIATPIHAAPISEGEARRLRKRAFIEQVAQLTRNGRYVATKAMAMDLDPDDIVCIQFTSTEHPERMPALHFEPADRHRVSVVVTRTVDYEHGPVFADLAVLL